MPASWLLAALYLTYVVAAVAGFIGRAIGASAQVFVEAVHLIAVTLRTRPLPCDRRPCAR